MQNQTRNLVIVVLVAALVVVTCWKQSPGQGEAAKPAVVKWEYKFTTSPTLQQDPDELNKLGSEGWDLCVVYPYADNIQTVILRRPKAAKD